MRNHKMKSQSTSDVCIGAVFLQRIDGAFIAGRSYHSSLIVFNFVLQDSSGQMDEFTLAADILPVVTSFNRVSCWWTWTIV